MSEEKDLTTGPIPTTLIHPRREPFEHDLLQIQKLVFTDPAQTLASLKQMLVQSTSSSSTTQRVDSATLSESLQISLDHAHLILETLASVLHPESDPLVRAKLDEIDAVGADLSDLILFLYIQSYKRLLLRTHKDSAVVADVCPSTSAFDGYLSALSPLQVVVDRVKHASYKRMLHILFFFVGNCLNFISFGYAAQSLLAALGSVQFVSNIAFAYFMLSKMVTVKVLVATTFIVLGNLFFVAFGNHQSPAFTPEQLAEKFGNIAFLVYCVILIFIVAVHHSVYRYMRQSMVLFVDDIILIDENYL